MRFSESQKQTLMVTGFLLAVSLAVAWYLQHVWGAGEIEKKDTKVEALSAETKDLQKKRNDYRQLANDKDRILAMGEKVELAARRLPRSPEESQFHQILSDTMNETSVYPIKVERLQPIQRDVYVELPYRIECFAKYHNLGEFFNLIEENPKRFMRIKQFKIDGESAILKERPSVQYAVIEVSTYYFLPREERS